MFPTWTKSHQVTCMYCARHKRFTNLKKMVIIHCLWKTTELKAITHLRSWTCTKYLEGYYRLPVSLDQFDYSPLNFLISKVSHSAKVLSFFCTILCVNFRERCVKIPENHLNQQPCHNQSHWDQYSPIFMFDVKIIIGCLNNCMYRCS